jgi:hypothetical protein
MYLEQNLIVSMRKSAYDLFNNISSLSLMLKDCSINIHPYIVKAMLENEKSAERELSNISDGLNKLRRNS